MASTQNTARWLSNWLHPSKPTPTIVHGLFAAGSTQEILAGQMLERTAAGNTIWVPLDGDFDMTVASEGGLAIAVHDIVAGDLAGYYEIAVPCDGDVFEFDLAAASALAIQTGLYYSSATALTVTPGTNILAYPYQGPNYPQKQHRLSQAQLGDMGTTIRSTSRARVCFCSAVSHARRLQYA